jgi:hypothetical protein
MYAAKDGTVYKKDANGGWSSNSGSGWESVSKPATTTTAQTRQPASTSTSRASHESMQSLNSQAQARNYGNQQSQRTSQYQSASSNSGGGRRR